MFGVEPLKIGTAKQVFIDDRFINNPQGVKLVVNKPRLDHEKLIVPENPWEDQVVGGYTSVIQEGKRTHLWYEARSQQGDWSLAYAYSTDDGATFIKPKLGVIEFAGSTANNLVLDNSLGAHVFLMGPGSPAGAKYGLFIHIRANARNWMGREDVNQRVCLARRHPLDSQRRRPFLEARWRTSTRLAERDLLGHATEEIRCLSAACRCEGPRGGLFGKRHLR